MAHFGSMFLAVDMSICAQQATQYAFALAKAFGAKLHVAHVVNTASFFYGGMEPSGVLVDRLFEPAKEHGRLRLGDIVNDAKGRGIDAEAHLLVGKPSEIIVQTVRELQCDLVVIGTHGHSGFSKLILGSTCEKVMRLSKVPVLAIRHREDEKVRLQESIGIHRILCPFDFSHCSRAAIPHALALSRECGATLLLMHVVDTRLSHPMFVPEEAEPRLVHLHEEAFKALSELALEIRSVPTDVKVVTGLPHEEIEAVSARKGIDLIVMATHGHTGLAHALLGSTTERLVRIAPCPVLTVHPRAALGVTERAEEAASWSAPV